jgi:dihydroneopterin aldolase
MPDLIVLRSHRVLAFIGALPEEQARRQPFEVDLDIEADLSVAGASDDLAETIDYGAVAATVEAALTDDRIVLLERAAQIVADRVLEHPMATAVTVEIRKLRPPVPHDLATSGVRIRRTR